MNPFAKLEKYADTTLPLFRKLTIKRRLSLVLGMMILLLVMALGVMLHSTIISYEGYISQEGSNLTGDVMSEIDAGISSLLAVTKYPVIQIDQRPTDTYNHLAYPSRYGKTILYADLEYRSAFLFEQNRKIRLISVFDMQGNGSYVRNNKRYTYQIAPSQQPVEKNDLASKNWFLSTLDNKGAAKIWRSDAVDVSEITLSDKENMVFVSRAIMSLSTFDPLGIILAGVDIGQSNEIFEAARRIPQQEIGVFDKNGEILWGSLSDGSIQAFLNSSDYISGSSGGSSNMVINNKNSLYQYTKGANGYYCLLVTPYYQVMYQALQQKLGVFAALFIGCIVIGMILRGIISSIVDPVKQLAYICNAIVTEEDFSVSIPDPYHDELSELTTAFNALTQRIEHLIYDVYEKRMELGQTQLQLLRSQVNPHFLYNTLETIRSKACLCGQMELGDMALLLASILRYGISAPGEMVRVEQEVQKLREYLDLQNYLYQDRFSANISIEPGILQLLTIKFILQPLVENALYHGLNVMAAPGTLEVLGYQEGNDVLFQVVDNGGGIGHERLEDLRGYLENKNSKLTSIGLKNVHRRIRLLYGADYGVTITSQPNVGTMVSVRIPRIEQNEIPEGDNG